MKKVLGGSHSDIENTYPALGKGHGYEAHHIFSSAAYDGVLRLSYGEGPAIRFDSRDDHRQTKSWGSYSDAISYREEQHDLILEGKFNEAWMNDVGDIREKFDTKYDEHIIQAEAYLLKLDAANKLQLGQEFKAELEQRQALQKEIEVKRAEVETCAKLEQEQKASELKDLEAKRTEAFEKSQKEIELKNTEAKQAETLKQEPEKQKEDVVRKLRLSNEMGEIKTLYYQFTPGELRPELTPDVKEQLWNLPDKTTITRQTIDHYQQQVAAAQTKSQQTSVQEYRMSI